MIGFANAVTDYFLAALHVGIFEAATECGGRTDVIWRIGVDQTDRASNGRGICQFLDLLNQSFAMQETDVAFVITSTSACFFVLHRLSP